jgi:hypothetical protein
MSCQWMTSSTLLRIELNEIICCSRASQGQGEFVLAAAFPFPSVPPYTWAWASPTNNNVQCFFVAPEGKEKEEKRPLPLRG